MGKFLSLSTELWSGSRQYELQHHSLTANLLETGQGGETRDDMGGKCERDVFDEEGCRHCVQQMSISDINVTDEQTVINKRVYSNVIYEHFTLTLSLTTVLAA